MRACAKLRCGAEAVLTVTLSRAERRVLIGELAPLRDPDGLDLCREHAERMTPPMGWVLAERDAAVSLAG